MRKIVLFLLLSLTLMSTMSSVRAQSLSATEEAYEYRKLNGYLNEEYRFTCYAAVVNLRVCKLFAQRVQRNDALKDAFAAAATKVKVYVGNELLILDGAVYLNNTTSDSTIISQLTIKPPQGPDHLLW